MQSSQKVNKQFTFYSNQLELTKREYKMSKKEMFGSWFNKKWAEWDAREERRTTQQELADYLGVSRESVAYYIRGKKFPEGENLRRIARRFGPEIYEILGIEDGFAQFPPSLAVRLRGASREINELLNTGEFAPGSPEHEAAAREVFARHGLELKDIEITED
jgi:transcriptional regulator with XRE-family HTH domain